jgi:HEAT repeat protein
MRTPIIAILLVAAFVQLAAVGPLPKPAAPSAPAAAARFEAEPDADLQLGIARVIVALGDRRVLPRLEHWLHSPDRHARGNAAQAAVMFCARGECFEPTMPTQHGYLCDDGLVG